MLGNSLATLVRLVDHIRAYTDVPGRFKNRLALSFDAVAGRKYVDMRVMLMARLLRLNRSPAVRAWLRQWRTRAAQAGVSGFDQALIRRLLR
jgi:hypothetical protein